MDRLRIIHDLRLRASFFAFVKNGKKTFEVQLDDKDFRKGDLVRFNEFKNNELTGDTIIKRIDYILRKSQGLMHGYLVLGFIDYE